MIRFYNSANIRAPACLVCRGDGLRCITIPVRYGLMRQQDGAFCLIDTGYGPRITKGQRSLALRVYNALLRPDLIESDAPSARLAAYGATPDDVKTIILTHFHADHVARLNEFPHARILTHGATARAVLAMSTAQAARHSVFPELLPPDLAQRIEAIEARPLVPAHPSLGMGHDLFGDGRFLAIPLPGHALGHFGLFWHGPNGPTLYATDATWTLKALQEDRTPAFARFAVFDDRQKGRETETRLRHFMREGGTILLCHDPEPR